MFLVSARVCCAVRRAAFPASSNLSGAAWRCFRTSSAALIKTPPEGWSADTLPNPSKHGDWVSTQPSSYVCNPDGVLTHGCEQTLNALLSELEHGVTVPCSGVDRPYQVAVVAVQHMRDGSDGATAEAFAKGVHDIWGVGYPPAQTGAVVFIALQDKQLYISTGVAVSQVLPDTFLKFLIADMRMLLRKKHLPDDALIHAVQSIKDVLEDKDTAEVWKRYNLDRNAGRFNWLVAALVLAFVWAFSKRQEHLNHKQMQEDLLRYNDCRHRLEALDKLAENDNPDLLEVTPMCLDCLAFFNENVDELDTITHATIQHPPRGDLVRNPVVLWCGHRVCQGCAQKATVQPPPCPACGPVPADYAALPPQQTPRHSTTAPSLQSQRHQPETLPPSHSQTPRTTGVHDASWRRRAVRSISRWFYSDEGDDASRHTTPDTTGTPRTSPTTPTPDVAQLKQRTYDRVLKSLQKRYPEYVNDDMTKSRGDAASTRLETHPHFRRSNPAADDSLFRGGRSRGGSSGGSRWSSPGSGRGFGGGSSSGGGGAGGSW